VGDNIHVSVDSSTRPHVEPCIAADPADAKHLIAATIAFTRADAWFTVAVFISFDGGQSWRRGKLEGLDHFGFVGDPWTAFGPNGVGYLCCLASSESNASVLVFRSSDGGRNWQKPSTVPFAGGGPYDRCSIVADTSTGKFARNVYVLASQSVRTQAGLNLSPAVVSRSTDGGVAFSDPVQILPNNLEVNVANPVVLSDGTLVVSFFDFASRAGDRIRMLKQRRLWIAASRDGGLTFSTPKFVAEFADPEAGVNQHSGPNRMLAVDRSSSVTFRDRLYMVWTSFQSGVTDIHLSYSTDKGSSWSDAIRVNDDDNKAADHATPAIAVNADGVVGVAWYDRRNDPTNKCFEIFFTASLDGGATFLPNARVSTVKSCPNVPGNVVRPETGGDGFGVAGRWPAGGDYSGLASSADGLFHVLWSDSRTGVYQNWTATVRVDPSAAQSTRASSVAYPELREELLKRLERDQAIRDDWIKKGADTPYEFQKEMLPLLRDAYRAGELPGRFYALLLDPVLVREGKPQIYGTQAKGQWKDHEPVLEPIEDEANVDRRRAEVGLPPLAEYLVTLKQMYFPKDKRP
jgi:hypothetical protein